MAAFPFSSSASWCRSNSPPSTDNKRSADSPVSPLSWNSCFTPSMPTLSNLSIATSAVPLPRDSRVLQHRVQQPAMIDDDLEVREAEREEHVGGGGQQFGLDRHR